VATNPIRAPATATILQASLLRVRLPDRTRSSILLAITRILPCAEAHRALVAAGAEAAVRALLAAGPASNRRSAAWRDVEQAASEVLAAIRQPPPPATARPTAAADAPQCAVCGKRAADVPGGRPLKRCAGCRGPER
jgi:hypothetical protein